MTPQRTPAWHSLRIQQEQAMADVRGCACIHKMHLLVWPQLDTLSLNTLTKMYDYRSYFSLHKKHYNYSMFMSIFQFLSLGNIRQDVN